MPGADSPKSRGFPLLLLLIVAAGAFALGAWWFRPVGSGGPTENTKVPPVAQRTAAPEKSTASTGAVHEALPASTEREKWLAALRAKLPTSLEGFLQSLTELAKTNPALAIDLAQELGRTDDEKTQWVTNTMQQWSDQDPEAAWQWLAQLPKERMQELAGGDLTGVVLGAMAARDPNLVISNLDAMLREPNSSESVPAPVAVHLGLMALVDHGQLALAQKVVEAWAKDPAKLDVESAAFDTVAMALAKTQPQETGDWLRSLPASEERNASMATFVATWAEHDPTAALRWAETLGAGEGQQAAIQRTVSDWIERYPNEISNWLGDYLSRTSANAQSDRLVETVINVSPTFRSSPQLALQWTNLISDPAKRATAEEKVALRWATNDRTAAIDYIWKSVSIPTGRKSVLVQQIQNATLTDTPE